jgi:hypothetical protein
MSELLDTRREAWWQARRYTPEMLELARQVLEDVREGTPVFDAIRRYPLAKGGYLGKHVWWLPTARSLKVESGQRTGHCWSGSA